MLSFVFAQPPALRASPFHRKGVDGFLPLRPPSSERSWRVAPEVGSHCGLKKNVKYAFPLIVIPSAAEGSFSFPVSVFLRNAVCMKHRVPTSQRVRCFPLSVILASFPDRKRKGSLASARNDDTGARRLRNNDRACGILACIWQNAERAIKKEIPFLRFPFLGFRFICENSQIRICSSGKQSRNHPDQRLRCLQHQRRMHIQHGAVRSSGGLR